MGAGGGIGHSSLPDCVCWKKEKDKEPMKPSGQKKGSDVGEVFQDNLPTIRGEEAETEDVSAQEPG